MKLAKVPAPVPTMTRDIDEIFDRFFNAPLAFPAFSLEPARRALENTWMPLMDLTETEREFVLRVEVPGVPRENMDVHLEGDILTLTGHRERVARETNENVLWEERETGKFQRNIRLPKAVEASKVEAVFQEGVLTVRLPKKATAIANKIVIKA